MGVRIEDVNYDDFKDGGEMLSLVYNLVYYGNYYVVPHIICSDDVFELINRNSSKHTNKILLYRENSENYSETGVNYTMAVYTNSDIILYCFSLPKYNRFKNSYLTTKLSEVYVEAKKEREDRIIKRTMRR